MKTSENTQEIFKALAAFRKVLKQPTKDAENPFFKKNYVTLDGVVKAIDEAIAGTGLSYLQEATTTDDGHVKVATYIFHESGEYISLEPFSLLAPKRDPQGFGSATTYAKRYALAAAFGVTSDVDDDGNQASESTPKNKQKSQPSKQKTKPMKENQITPDQLAEIELMLDVVPEQLNQSADDFLVENKLTKYKFFSKDQADRFIEFLNKKLGAVKPATTNKRADDQQALFNDMKPPMADDIEETELPFDV